MHPFPATIALPSRWVKVGRVKLILHPSGISRDSQDPPGSWPVPPGGWAGAAGAHRLDGNRNGMWQIELGARLFWAEP
jgi:hypothetical protein